jgi:hypothetical protein
MVQEIEKYIKLHVLGDLGDNLIGISEDIQKDSVKFFNIVLLLY